ncbi:hypothetical protein DSM107003_17140 [Trichormus variabilis SAG 1403-4b]|uniref:Uncharacterized protein n=1 Tax=Trichormus variabilis SAG 1403-4b TaxID=447716 RepID=A0A433UVJ0_ANAVA|nr:hypothetical protein DSM107003_17140 [Trichormus variabilis SAG 1403-4b]
MIPTHNNSGGVGASVAWAKKGKGTVSARYRLNRVILIKGDRRKTEVDVVVTAKSQF